MKKTFLGRAVQVTIDQNLGRREELRHRLQFEFGLCVDRIKLIAFDCFGTVFELATCRE